MHTALGGTVSTSYNIPHSYVYVYCVYEKRKKERSQNHYNDTLNSFIIEMQQTRLGAQVDQLWEYSIVLCIFKCICVYLE